MVTNTLIEEAILDFLEKNTGFSLDHSHAMTFREMTLGELYLDSLMLLELGIFFYEKFQVDLDPALLAIESKMTVGFLINQIADAVSQGLSPQRE